MAIRMLRLTLGLLATMGLVACGGGGGDSGNSDTSQVNLTFVPGTLSAKQLVGASGLLQVVATADRDVSGVINVGVVFDRAGVFDPNTVVIIPSGRSTTARLNTLSIGAPGIHSGTIEVRLCRDAPQICASPIPGSPWKLPYQITVVAPTVEISTASISQDCYAAECPSVPIAVSIVNPQIGSFVTPYYFVGAQDSAGIFNVTGCITNFVSVSVVGQCSMTAQVRSDVPAGSYAGTLNVTLGTDSTTVTGMQVTVPYSVTVRPASNPTPLARLPVATEWTQEQGNAQHTGYVPITLAPTKFTRRWRWENFSRDPSGNTAISLVTDSDRVFYADLTLSSSGTKYGLGAVALSEETGQESTISSVAGWAVNSNLTTHGGHLIFTGQVPGYFVKSLYILNSTDDGVAFSYWLPTPGGQPETNRSITVVDDKVYGEAGVFSAFDGAGISSGVPVTFQPFAMTNSFSYGFRPAEFIGVPTSGSGAFSVSDQNVTGWEIPILGGLNNAIVFMSPNLTPTSDGAFSTAMAHLKSYNLTTKAVSWDIAAQSNNAYTPAVANGVVYFVNGNSLEARSEISGALLWSWSPAGGALPSIRSNIVVTNNLIFVGTTDSIYAIDASSHQTVWTDSLSSVGYPSNNTVGSSLAISPNGILYVGTRLGVIAFNLH